MVVLLTPVGCFFVIYMIKGMIKGSINPWYSYQGKPCKRRENPFMFWTYIAGGLLMGLLLIIYSVFSLLARWK